MSGILDMITNAIGQGSIGQLSNEIGADPSKTTTAVSAALPMILGAMSRHAETGTGAQQIHEAVTSPGNPPAAPEPSPSSQPASQSGGGLLSSILGEHQPQVQQGVARASGLDPHQAAKVLMYLAPIVVGVLARRHQDQPNSTQQPGGLAGMLGQAAQAAESHLGSGGLSGMLGGLLGG